MFLPQYVYKSPIKRLFVLIFDLWTLFLYRPFRRKPELKARDGRIKKIAVIRFDRIGDHLLCLKAVFALRSFFPAAKIYLYTDERNAPLMERTSFDVVRGFKVNWYKASRSNGKWFDGRKAIQDALTGDAVDLAIDFRGDIRTAMIMKSAGIPLRLGRPEGGGKYLLTHCLPRPSRGHEVEHNLQLLSFLGESPETSNNPFSGKSPTRARIDGLLGIDGQEQSKRIVVHPYAACDAKEWDFDAWKDLILRLLMERGVSVCMIGTQQEKERVPFNFKHESFYDLRGKVELEALPELFEGCSLFIGMDSGPGHIAAASGIPMITLFSGANVAERWRPYSQKSNVIRHQVDCSPCESVICPLKHKNCMLSITVSEVFGAVQSKLQESRL